jgi:hypothetical protein
MLNRRKVLLFQCETESFNLLTVIAVLRDGASFRKADFETQQTVLNSI